MTIDHYYNNLDNSIIDNSFKWNFLFWKRVLKFKLHFNKKLLAYALSRLNRDLTKLFVLSEGLVKIVTDRENGENMIAAYPNAKKALESYQHIFFALENNKFFESLETKEICEKTLSNFYAAESHIRMNSNFEVSNNDNENIEFATHVSLTSF